jgi:DNA repair photolyase
MRRSAGAQLGLHCLRALRMGTLRMTSTAPRQLPLFEQLAAPAEWHTIDQRVRGTRFIDLPVKSVLNSPAATHMGFWSVNPYVGCEFGCTYCYARDTHRYTVERAHHEGRLDDETFREFRGAEGWEAFENRILVKLHAPAVLARTLDPRRLAGNPLVIGTATDPYQPAERRFRLTRSILETLLAYRGLSIGIITKSPLVARDIDVLTQLGGRHRVSVHVSIATANARLARRLEPRSPVPSARLRALGRLTAAGVRAGILVAPILPGITDDVAGLSGLLAAARQLGAHYAVASPLRLGPAARRRFLPYLAEEFPELSARYQRHFARAEQVSPAYQRALHRRFEALQRLHGYDVSEGMREEQGWREPASGSKDQPSLF